MGNTFKNIINNRSVNIWNSLDDIIKFVYFNLLKIKFIILCFILYKFSGFLFFVENLGFFIYFSNLL